MPPSVVSRGGTIASLQARHDAISNLYRDNESAVHDIQKQALEELLPILEEELDLQEVDRQRVRAFLDDPVTVFRFCRRARFSVPASLQLLHATLTWRLTSSLSLLSPSHLSPLYSTNPLFFFHPSLCDRFGRPCAVLNLRHVRRTEDGELDGLKEFVRLGWEIGRRWLLDLSKQGDGEVKVQMVVIVDLEGAGMSNLEVEMLPFFMDLLKNHFPGMVGAIFVLNYGWMYSGMWQLAKRVLPNTALERILFPSKAELLQFFDESHLLVEHGGSVVYEYTTANPILNKYGRPFPHSSSSAYPSPASSPTASVAPSRNASSESIHDFFHSANNTPAPSAPTTPNLSGTFPPRATLRRRTSGLNMTSLSQAGGRGGSATPGERAGGGGRGRSDSAASLRRVTSFAELQERLAETQAAIESDSSSQFSDEEVDEGAEAIAAQYARHENESVDVEGDTGERSNDPSAVSSRATSRATSRNVSRAVSREGSQTRSPHDLGTFSSRSVRFSGTNHISPYNHSNPYYGYPAFVPSTSLDPSGVPRPHYHRRRKRDLVRTLTYLAVLRFLALHRQVKWRLSTIIEAILRITGLKRLRWGGQTKDAPTTSKVRWENGDQKRGATEKGAGTRAGASGHSVVQRLPGLLGDVRLVYALVLFLLLRSPLAARAVQVVFRTKPKAILPCMGKIQRPTPPVGRRKRDLVRGMLGMGSRKA